MTDAPSWQISELIPHRPPMILIDDIVSVSDVGLTARVYIGEEKPFYEPRLGVPAWIGIEYMAQSISAFAGFQRKSQGQPIQLGFLLGTRKYQAHTSAFRLGSTLWVSIEEEFRADEMGTFDCMIKSSGHCLAEARLNVFVPENIDAFLSDGKSI